MCEQDSTHFNGAVKNHRVFVSVSLVLSGSDYINAASTKTRRDLRLNIVVHVQRNSHSAQTHLSSSFQEFFLQVYGIILGSVFFRCPVLFLNIPIEFLFVVSIICEGGVDLSQFDRGILGYQVFRAVAVRLLRQHNMNDLESRPLDHGYAVVS